MLSAQEGKLVSERRLTQLQDQASGSCAQALSRFAIIFTTFAFLLIILGFAVFFSSSHILPDAYTEVFASLVLVSAGTLALIPAYLLLKSTQKFRSISTKKGQDFLGFIDALNSLITAHGLLRLILGLTIMGVAITAIAVHVR